MGAHGGCELAEQISPLLINIGGSEERQFRKTNWRAKDLNRDFSREDTQTVSEHMKGSSASLIIRKWQSDAPHIQSDGCYQKTENNECWWGWGETGTSVSHWWEHKVVQLLWKTVWWFLKIFKIELPYDPAIPFLDIYQKKWNKSVEISEQTCS